MFLSLCSLGTQPPGPILGWAGISGTEAQVCPTVNITNTRVYTQSGVASKCFGGASVTEGAGNTGNTLAELPSDEDVMQWARVLLRMDAK